MENGLAGQAPTPADLEEILDHTETVVWRVDQLSKTVEYRGPAETDPSRVGGQFDEFHTVLPHRVHPEDRATVEAAFGRLLGSESPAVDIEYRTAPGAGESRWIRTQAVLATPTSHSQVSNSAGDGSGDDATRSRVPETTTDEKALARPSGSQTVVGLSTDITPLQSRTARLEEFTSVLAHDLRSPLTVARLRLDQAEAATDEQTRTEGIEKASDALERVEDLITDLLALARGGDIVGETESVALATVARACWAAVDTAQATLVIETDQRIMADESRLRQLLENLFRNAIEHGGESVTVTIESLPDGFAVSDNGNGFDEEWVGLLFEVDDGGLDPSTGLGLQIVAQIAAGHDWTVNVENGPAGGARFEFTGVESA